MKEFKCDICNFGYNQVHKLTRHIERDHGNAIFECDLCGKLFKTATYLKNHCNLIHDKKQLENYKCVICYKEFRNENLLKGHVLNVHDENKFKCQFCDKSFSNRANLNSHAKRKHSDSKEDLSCEICNIEY